MKSFKKNSCRLCPKVFCCQNCRERHEQNFHGINLKCNICIYGQTFLRNPSPELIKHIESEHLPLHCVNCDRYFFSVKDTAVHNKCSDVYKKKAEETPENEQSKFHTPSLCSQIIIKNKQCVMYEDQICITTSTPVARGDNDFVQIISEVITPVDNLENKETANNQTFITSSKSALTPILCDTKKSDQHSKRKVTFSEHIQECSDDESRENISTTPSRYDLGQENHTHHTHDSEVKFYTANEKLIDFNEEMEQCENEKNEAVVRLPQNSADFQDSLWESALSSNLDVSRNTSMEVLIARNQTVSAISCVCAVKDCFKKSQKSPIANLSTIAYLIRPIRHISNSQVSEVNDYSEKSTGIWSSMANIFRNVIHGLSNSGATYGEHSNLLEKAGRLHAAQKRPKPIEENPEESPAIKKMKLTEIKCRRPIRNIRPFLQLRYARKRTTYAHKLTQTD